MVIEIPLLFGENEAIAVPATPTTGGCPSKHLYQPDNPMLLSLLQGGRGRRETAEQEQGNFLLT
jgi:hypothetical protein